MFFNSGIRGARARDGVGSVANRELFVQKKDPVPSITSWAIQGSDDTSLDPAGGQTVVVTGTGFAAGLTGIVGSTTLASVTVVSPSTATFTSTAKSAGSYTLILSNTSGSAAIYIPGITYSSIPTYTTSAGSIGTNYETTAISTQVVATSDSAITYSLDTGALPSGATLYANGVITGTAPVDSSSTTYSFSIKATDAELQDVTRSFTLTINTDVVTWSSPGSGTTYAVVGGSPISNVTLTATSAAGYGVTYTANALPTGLALSSGVISGTPTTEANTTSLLTATAATTNRSATNTIYWVVTLSDPYFKYNSMLMSSTVVTNTFVSDASSNNLDITIVGDTKPSKFDPFEPGYYSGYFDGTGDYLSVPYNVALAPQSSSFTVEAWVYFSSSVASSQHIISNTNNTSGDGDWALFYRADQSRWEFYCTSTGFLASAVRAYNTTVPVVGTWYHVAGVKNGSTTSCYVNGVKGTDATIATVNTSSGVPYFIGAGAGPSALITGYISNLRVVKGTAVYTSNFTPSTTPLTAISGTSLLTCQSSGFVDNSANAFTITVAGNIAVNSFQPFTPNSSYATYGSTLFDGTGDYLTYTQPSIRTSAFTIELWIYLPATNSDKYIYAGSNTTSGPLILLNSSGGISIGVQGGFLFTCSSVVPIGQWNHVALVREGTGGSQTKLYLNGVLDGSGTMSTNFSSGLAAIGGGDTGVQLTTSYISNFRLVNGTAVYTAAFTPPTTPLTAITNTGLLTCQTTVPATTTTMVDESGQNNSITRNGNTNIGTFSPLNGAWSNYFDGTGDYLSMPTNTAFAFGAGNFTIEAWIYDTGTTAAYGVIVGATTYGVANEFVIALNGSTRVLYAQLGDVGSGTSTGTITAGTWNHVALVRNGSTITFYINGVSSGSYTDSDSVTSTITPTIGAASNVNADSMFKGYISNLRVVKGTAVYTAAFTPSTTPLNSIANTSLLTCNSNSFVDYSPIRNVITRNGDTVVNKFSPFPGYITNFASYSGYFDGTGDYLTTPVNAGFDMGTGDFTFECFVINYGYSGSQYGRGLFTIYTSGSYTNRLMVRLSNGDNAINIYANGSGVGTYFGTSGTNGTTQLSNSGQWYHIAFVRQSLVFKLYVNGVQDIIVSNQTASLPSSSLIEIGRNQDGSIPDWNGLISNFRVVKGTAVYTATFTPPTAPLTAIANTSLLTCQSTTFIDNSTNALVITVNGNTRPVIQNPFVNTFTSPVAYSPTTVGTSMYFDGTGDYLLVPDNNTWAFSGDFTIESWIYPTTLAAETAIFTVWFGGTVSATAINFNMQSTGRLRSEFTVGSSAITTTTGTTTLVTANQWNHVAVTRSGTTIRLFVNGVQDSTTGTLSGTINNLAQQPVIGAINSGGTYSSLMNGYISNLRVVNGTAVYTGPFVPSASPLPAVQNTVLLVSSTITPSTYDAAELSDMETAGTAKLTTSNSPYYGSYSGAFDGSGDYLTLPFNAAMGAGNGDFTLEVWAYPTSSAGNMTIIDGGNNAGGRLATDHMIYLQGAMQVTYLVNGSNVITGAALVANVWTHIAVVRSGSSTKMYINGTQSGSTWSDSTNYGTQQPFIGRNSDGNNNPWAGYISNLRFVKGTAVYTATFTPPTAPLTAISGTSYLVCQSNRFIDNSTNAFAITIYGNTQVSTFQPFGGSNLTKYSSAYFVTKTDTFGMRPQPGFTTFASDFTLECWVYPSNSAPDYWSAYDARQTGQTAANFVFGLEPLPSPVSGSFRMLYYNTTSNYGNGITVFKNQWTYLTWVRSGTTMTYYVNGVSAGFNTVSGTQTASATTNLVVIGSKDSSLSGYGTLGYIADLRITNGYARYTTTFTPPTVPLIGF